MVWETADGSDGPTARPLFYLLLHAAASAAAAPLVSRVGERWVPFGLSPLRFSFVEHILCSFSSGVAALVVPPVIFYLFIENKK